MTDPRSAVALDALEIARSVAARGQGVPPTLFLVRERGVDWAHPVALSVPSEYASVAEAHGARAVVVIFSHYFVDEDEPDVRLLQLFAGLVNAKGEVLAAAKCQRWTIDDLGWTNASVIEGPLQVSSGGWRV
jgi:hypothetical protein